MHPISIGIVLGALMIQLPTCSRETGPGGSGPSVELESIEILHVELDRPVLARDAEGEPRTFEDAYMVRLALETSAVPTAPAFHVFVGDRRISELGGWQRGVYFYVHDPALLERLAGGELFYQIGAEKRRSLKARLEIGVLEAIRTVRESDLFPNRPNRERDAKEAEPPREPMG